MPEAAPAAVPATSSPAPSSAAPSGNGAQAKTSAQPAKPNPVGNQNAAPQNGNAPPKPETTAPQLHKWKDKIAGKEVEFEASDDDLRAAYRQRTAADRRWEEAARLRKEASDETSRTQETLAQLADPSGEKLLEIYMRANPNADPVEVLATILQRRMQEEEQLQDPNIRERRRLEQENKDFRSKAENERQARVQFEQDRAVEVERDRVARKFTEAISLTKLPVNDMTIKLMAEAEFTKRKQGWDLTPEQLARSTEKAMHSIVESIMTDENTTDDQLLAAFPKLTERIHKAIVGRYKARQAGGQQRPSDITPRERRPSAEEQTNKPRVISSAEEHKLYGGRGLRTL